MKSTWGRRGAILEKFGWTWEYITWKVPFVVVQRVMADMPWFKYEKADNKGKPKGKAIKLTDTSFLDMVNQINSHPI